MFTLFGENKEAIQIAVDFRMAVLVDPACCLILPVGQNNILKSNQF